MIFNRFPVRLHNHVLRSSGEKMAESFTVISNVAVTRRLSINKKGEDLLIKGIFKPEQNV